MRLVSSSLVAMLILLLTTSCVPVEIIDPHAVPAAEELERLVQEHVRSFTGQETRGPIRISTPQPWQDGFMVAFTAQTKGWYEEGYVYFKLEASGWTAAQGAVGGGVASWPPGAAVGFRFDELGREAVAIHGPVLSNDVAIVEATDETGATVRGTPNNGGILLVLSPVEAVRRVRALDKDGRVLEEHESNYWLSDGSFRR